MEGSIFRIIERKSIFELKDDFYNIQITGVQDGMRQVSLTDEPSTPLEVDHQFSISKNDEV